MKMNSKLTSDEREVLRVLPTAIESAIPLKLLRLKLGRSGASVLSSIEDLQRKGLPVVEAGNRFFYDRQLIPKPGGRFLFTDRAQPVPVESESEVSL